jgi:hypothetical protein
MWLSAGMCLQCSAQAPAVGDINFYGLRSLTPEQILNALRLKPGDPLPGSKGDLEDRIAELPGVALASVEAVCCEGRIAALFIGVEEQGAPRPDLRTAPSGEATLPQDVVDLYMRFLAAVRRGGGHSATADRDARALEDRFGQYAAANLDLLRSVLRSGPDPDQRAAAAAVIGYAPRKADVVDDLQLAIQDPEPSVRANALRALDALAALASKQPAPGLRISPTGIIQLLHSAVLSDRVESLKLLLTLTDRPAPQVLDQIREQALDDVIEMARWKTPDYALPPFLLAGRLAGMTDPLTQQAWRKGDREAVLQRIQPKH